MLCSDATEESHEGRLILRAGNSFFAVDDEERYTAHTLPAVLFELTHDLFRQLVAGKEIGSL